MKKVRPVFLSIIGLIILLVLATGCYRPGAPDVTATPAAGAEAGEETPPAVLTGVANSTIAAQETEESEASPVPSETPTEPAPTATPTAAPTSLPTPTRAVVTATPTAPPPTAAPSGEVTHVVRRGENLFRIALRYGTTVEAIAQANGIANPRRIYVGQELTIPSTSGPAEPAPGGESTYIVQPGDNLFRIALQYNMSYVYLAEYNGISNPANIYVGQKLKIPPR